MRPLSSHTAAGSRSAARHENTWLLMPKPWRTAQAEEAIAGYSAVLIESDSGRPELIITRWAMTRSFADLEEFASWLRCARGSGARPALVAPTTVPDVSQPDLFR